MMMMFVPAGCGVCGGGSEGARCENREHAVGSRGAGRAKRR